MAHPRRGLSLKLSTLVLALLSLVPTTAADAASTSPETGPTPAQPQPAPAPNLAPDPDPALGPLTTYHYQSEDGTTIFEFEWNSQREPWLEFHLRICGKFCNGTEAVELGEVMFPICPSACFPCDCRTSCALYGTCCPGLSEATPLAPRDRKRYFYSESYAPVYFVGESLDDYDFVDNNDYGTFVKENPEMGVDVQFEGRFSCLTTSWMGELSEHYYAITDCPVEWKNDTLRQLCETTDIDTFTVESATPITDIRNGIVYKNSYCLQCNAFDETDNKTLHFIQEDYSADDDVLVSGRTSSADEAMTSATAPYRKWKVGVSCKHYQKFYTLESADAFLRAVLRDAMENLKSPCYVKFEPPKSQKVPSRNCKIVKSEESPIGEVHPTGECLEKEGMFVNISHLCQSLNAEAFRIYQRQNVFCYLCLFDFPTCQEPRHVLRPYVTSPLSFLMGGTSAVTHYSDSNPGHSHREGDVYLCKHPLEWMDEKGNCRQPECTKGKKLLGGKCESIVGIVTRLGYKVQAMLKLQQDLHEDDASTLVHHIASDIFAATTTSGSLEVSMVVYGTEGSNLDNHVKHIILQGHLVSEADMPRDDFENGFLNHSFAFNYRSTYSDEPAVLNTSPVFIGTGVSKYLHALFMSDQTPCRLDSSRMARPQNRHQSVVETSNNSTKPSKLVLKCVYSQFQESLTASPDSDGPPVFSEFRKKRYYAPQSESEYEKIWDMKSSFIELTHSLICPYVTFNVIDINVSAKSGEVDVQFKYRNKIYTIDVASSSYMDSVSIVNRRQLRICVETFRKEFQKVEDHIYPNTTFTISLTEKAKRYFTLVCFLLSAVCLVLTIATYLAFSELRTLPGLNTLMLSISLVIAQIFLVVVVESVGFIGAWLCMGLGMGLHYSWLVACQWMSVCCFHMFTVFRGIQTRLSSAQVKSKFEWYCFYAFGGSAVVVALTIILSEIVSGTESTGYSPELCVFDNAWSRLVALLSFAFPVGLIALSNLAMLGATVRQMAAVTRLQGSDGPRKKGRAGVVTYAKLSSMTGLFWLLTILAAHLGNTVLDFISIPLVALQGVFIFFSFTFNANTKRLFCKMFCRDGSGSGGGGGKGGGEPAAAMTTSPVTMTTATRVSLVLKDDAGGGSGDAASDHEYEARLPTDV